jgi:hypothetical protein
MHPQPPPILSVGFTTASISCLTGGYMNIMLLDILIAAIIVIVAAILGLTVHPFLWFIVILAVLWLLGRRGRWSRT